MLTFALCCLALVLGAIAGGLFTSRAYRTVMDRERQMADAQLSAWQQHSASLSARADVLGRMLDERRAYDLKVTPPPMPDVAVGPSDAPLASEYQRELAAIEDEEARTEFEALIRSAIAQHPTRPADRIIAEVFGG
jgi:hypothetical protein